jgi:thiol-disulfide isomerase/thioredoxin
MFMALLSFNSNGQNTRKKMSGALSISHVDHKVTVVNFDKLESIIKKKDNKLYVVNFWATWCRPCVMELPEFMAVNKIYRDKPDFKMILVSLDIASQVELVVQPFIAKNKIDADVYLLDDNKRMNQWIPAVDKNWSGSIPATVFYRNGIKLDFKESKMQKSELVKLISKYLYNN